MSKFGVSDQMRAAAVPDEFGRVSPFAVYSRPEKGAREIVSRNLRLATAEELAQYLADHGHVDVHVSYDVCG